MQEIIHRFEPLWGTWTVDKLLGAGSFGKVWQVSSTDETGTHYAAVKEVVIPFVNGDLSTAASEGLDIPGAKKYFEALLTETLKEVELMQELAVCRTVVHIDDYQVRELDREGEFGWVILIRMERLVPFKTRLLEQGITVSEVARLGIDISHALTACEEHGIVHRDIKPDNLFYCPEDGSFRLGDFGIAHYLARPTEGKGRAGTLTHMPPEVYQGAPFTTGADLYALGMILYRLLNDNRVPRLPPFPEPFTPVERDRALVQRLKGAEVEEPSIVRYAAAEGAPHFGLGARFDESGRTAAAALGKIAQKAISADPSARFASALELRQAIQAAVHPTSSVGLF